MQPVAPLKRIVVAGIDTEDDMVYSAKQQPTATKAPAPVPPFVPVPLDVALEANRGDNKDLLKIPKPPQAAPEAEEARPSQPERPAPPPPPPLQGRIYEPDVMNVDSTKTFPKSDEPPASC